MLILWFRVICDLYLHCPELQLKKVRKVELREKGITDDTWDSVLAGFKVTRDGILSTKEKFLD